LGKSLHTLQEHRGFTPFGMMEHWNNGFRGIEGMGIGKIKLTNQKRNEKSELKPFGRRRISIIPLFHVRGKIPKPQKISIFFPPWRHRIPDTSY